MTFLEKTKRFFEPLQANYSAVIISIFRYTFWAIYSLFSVYIIRESVKLFGVNDMLWLTDIIYEYVGFSIIFFTLTWFLRNISWPILDYDVLKWLYRNHIEKLMQVDNNYIESLGTGRLISNIFVGIKTWTAWLMHLIEEWTKIIVVVWFILFLFFSKNFTIWLLFILVLIILQAFIIYFDNTAHKYRKMRTDKRSEGSRQLVRIIMSRNEILQSSRVEDEVDWLLQILEEERQPNFGINRALFWVFNLVRIAITCVKIALLVFIIHEWVNWSLSVADVAGLLALFTVFEGFITNSVEFYKNFTKDFSDIEKLWDTFDNAPLMRGYETGKTFSSQKKDISIQNISYGYNETKVFCEFSIKIEQWKKTAIVGASWWGKTTLMKLLAGYLHPDSWYISIMGNRLDETALKTYYPHIGYLTQDPGVFDATIRENLVSAISHLSSRGTRDLFSENRADFSQARNDKNETEGTEQKLIYALSLAHCDFVFDLEKWLDTEIGERGVRLSWGQKQRLAIAKIFLKNPEIILLDEPTSALDSFSEEAITEALDILFKDKTVIIVAHRLQTVRKADDIIVLEWWGVVERGNHKELVKKWGIYNRMLELQSGF